MSTDAEILLERIDVRLAAMGQTRYWLSKAITDGKQAGVITDLARKKFIPKEDRLRRMAEVLETTPDYLLGRSNNPDPIKSEVAIASLPQAHTETQRRGDGIPLVGTGDCAELQVTTEAGQMIEIERSSFDPNYTQFYVDRPAALAGRTDVYAIYFHGSSMEPRYFAGEIGMVDPRRPVSTGDFVVVQLGDGTSSEVTSVIVKRLIKLTAREVVLYQYNPQATFSLPRRQVVRIHRILPQTEELLKQPLFK